MSKNRKAVLVNFSLMTRVVVDENATDQEIYEQAIQKLLNTDGMIRDKLECGVEDIEEDTECPFGSFEEENN